MSLDFSDARDADLKRAYEHEQNQIVSRNPGRGCSTPCSNLVQLLANLKIKYADKLAQRKVARPRRR